MANEAPNWQGLLKWSLSHADGTNPTRNLSEEEQKWFREAMEAQTVDIVKRMKEITLVMKTPEEVLVSQGVTHEDIEDMLDELQEHVESIDMANDLHSIGGLAPLLDYLKHPNAKIKAKAAEVVSTIVQNNSKSQELVMKENGLELLVNIFASDPDVVARTKALGAISSLIRHNKPATDAFLLDNGYGKLRDALNSGNVRFQRKALNLIRYLLGEDPSGCGVVVQLRYVRHLFPLASSTDGEVREGALGIILDLTRGNNAGGGSKRLSKEEEETLKQILQERVKGIMEMSAEDLKAVKEERHLVDSLWRFCYSESSPLREKGLLVLAGEVDASLPPDIASQFFKSPLRAFAANSNSGNNEAANSGKNEAPLLIGPP